MLIMIEGHFWKYVGLSAGCHSCYELYGIYAFICTVEALCVNQLCAVYTTSGYGHKTFKICEQIKTDCFKLFNWGTVNK